MLLTKLNALQITFIILTPIVIAIIVLLFVVLPLKKRKIKDNFMEYCYKAIYRIAFDEDYYLINDFYFRAETSKVAKIDHILFGNKYIYIITDKYYDGDISGKDNDKSLILIDSHNQKYYIDNPYVASKNLINYLCTSTGLDPTLFIGVTLTNDNIKLAIASLSKQYYIIQRNRLKKLVKAIESRDVGRINPEQLDNAVKAIDRLNRKKKTNDK